MISSQTNIPLSQKVRGREGEFEGVGVRHPLNSPISGILPYIDQVLPDYLDDSSFDEHFSTFKKLIVLPGDRIGNWGLPGHGESKESCGSFFMKGCLNISDHPDGLGYFEPHVHKCFSPSCPTCWLLWCKRASGRIQDRINSYLSIHKKLKPIHVVASVPRGSFHMRVADMRKKAQKYVKKVGFWGGSCIFHPFRQQKGSGIWYFSPHFHFIGVGWIQGTDSLYARSGWIVKNVRVRQTVFGTAFYQLTHSGVWYGEGRKSTTTWFGCMSYNKMMMDPLDYGRQKRCPYCGEKIFTLIWIGEGDPPLPCGRGYLASAENWSSWLFEYYNSLWFPHDFDKYEKISDPPINHLLV